MKISHNNICGISVAYLHKGYKILYSSKNFDNSIKQGSTHKRHVHSLMPVIEFMLDSFMNKLC